MIFKQYAIFINGGHAKKQWDQVHASKAYEALLHCFPLFSCLISLACMHLVPLFYACPPFMNMVYTYQMWPLLLKFIREQDYGKILHQGYDAMFTQILAFYNFSPLINKIFKTKANCKVLKSINQ